MSKYSTKGRSIKNVISICRHQFLGIRFGKQALIQLFLLYFQVKIWFQNRRMKWRNSKERELIAQGGCREQTLPTKHNPNPDLSDAQPQQPRQQQPPPQPQRPHNPLEAMAKTRMAFNEALWTLPPPLQQHQITGKQLEDDPESSDINDEDDLGGHEDDEMLDEDDDEEINVT
jgi:hypothetical protein